MTKIYLPLSFLGALALSSSLLLGACGDDSSSDEPGSSGGTSAGGSSAGGSSAGGSSSGGSSSGGSSAGGSSSGGSSSAGKGGQEQGGAGSGDAGKGGSSAGSGGSPAGAGGSPAGAGGSPAGAGGSPAGAGGEGGAAAGAGGEGGSAAGAGGAAAGAGGAAIQSCEEIGAPGCFSNYDCADETNTCSSLNANELVVCCIKGARGKGKAGDACTGEADCQSALCIDSDKVGKVCTDKCTTPDDCPAGMKKCLYIAGSGSQFNFCAPGDAP